MPISIRSLALSKTGLAESEQLCVEVPPIEHERFVSARLVPPTASTFIPRRRANVSVIPKPGGASTNTTNLFMVQPFGMTATTAPVSAAAFRFDPSAANHVVGEARPERS
jgi:hypothetical protein